MRKEADFDVVDRIIIGFDGSEELKEAVVSMKKYIMSETLAEGIELEMLDISDFIKDWEIGGTDCKISVRRNVNS